MLDDECKLPGASDEKLASRLFKALEGHHRFSSNPAQKRDSKFCVRHYAGPVVYSTLTFVDKNKDESPKEANSLIKASTIPLLARIFECEESSGGGDGGGRKNSGGKADMKTVGGQFREQLLSLMEKIYSTTPHYIRCLKPNDENVPDNFNRNRTTEQLRYGGVLEAVRVARSGGIFPTS